MKTSVALAVFNEEKNLGKCLDAVSGFADEIVIVDGGSADRTVQIAQKYHAKIIQTDNPPIFHINKQKALDACSGDWILQLDADEIVTEELKIEIISTINAQCSMLNAQMPNGYFLPRKNYFLGHWLKKGGLYPDEVIRLVKKGNAGFPCQSVHEQIKIEGAVGHLKNPLLHYTNPTLKDYWKNSLDRYSTLTAREMKEKYPKNSLKLLLESCFGLPLYWLYLRLVKNKGIFDGIYGIIFAIGSAVHYPFAYIKYLKLK